MDEAGREEKILSKKQRPVLIGGIVIYFISVFYGAANTSKVFGEAPQSNAPGMTAASATLNRSLWLKQCCQSLRQCCQTLQQCRPPLQPPSPNCKAALPEVPRAGTGGCRRRRQVSCCRAARTSALTSARRRETATAEVRVKSAITKYSSIIISQ
jgi:hypothetical protein